MTVHVPAPATQAPKLPPQHIGVLDDFDDRE